MRKFILTIAAFLCWTSTWAATITFIGGVAFWDDPANWDLGFVPTAVDDVIIPAGQKVGIPGGFSAVAQSVVVEGGLFVLGDLTVDNSPSHGILLDGGRLDNRGDITISNSALDALNAVGGKMKNRSNGTINLNGTGDDGLDMDAGSILLNIGQVNVNGPNPDDGFYCAGTLVIASVGRIDVTDATNYGFNFTGKFENYGTMTASNNIGVHGVFIESATTCINRAGGIIEVKQAGDVAVFVFDGTLLNENNALIDVYDFGFTSSFGQGVFVGGTLTNAVLQNFGTILMHDALNGNANGLHIYVDGKVFNESTGIMDIFNISGEGVYQVSSGILENLSNGQILINDVSGHGLYVTGDIQNHGIIEGEGFDLTGMYVLSTGNFDNYGDFRALDVGLAGAGPFDEGLWASGTITNHDCGKMRTDAHIAVSGTFNNNGYLKIEGTHNGSGSLTNNGVIEDYNDGLSSFGGVLTNNAVIGREIPAALSVGVPYFNFFELGSLAGHTINGIYTDETLTTFAGAYGVAANTFTPFAASVGLTELYARISDTSPICSGVIKISVPMGISLTGGPTEKSLNADDLNTTTFEFGPNPTTGILTVTIPTEWDDSATQFEIYDLLGQQVNAKITTNSRMVVLELPATAPTGMYFIRGLKNGELVQTSPVILQR